MELLNPKFANLIAIAAIVLGLILAGWWVTALYGMRTRDEEDKLPQTAFPADIHEGSAGVPPALRAFYIFIALSLIGYVLYIWLGGISY